jgi:lipid A oxidase
MERERRGRSELWLSALVTLALATADRACAQTVLSFYSGKSFSADSDLRIRQPGQNTDLQFEGVSYDDESFASPIYYGIRVTHFFKRQPWLGASIDFFHYKVIAETERTVHAIGTEQGVPVDRSQPLGDTIQRFSISHGVNYLTLNVLGRLRWQRDERFPDGRLQPYAGAGVGGLLLHPESNIGGASFQQYEWNGLGYQLLLGVEYRVTDRWGLFAEYKFNRRRVNVEIAGGSADTRLQTNHLAVGTSYRL